MQKSKELVICLSEGTSFWTVVNDALLYNPCLVTVIAVPSAMWNSQELFAERISLMPLVSELQAAGLVLGIVFHSGSLVFALVRKRQVYPGQSGRLVLQTLKKSPHS